MSLLPIAFMGLPGGSEILIVLVVAMFLFGATRLPKMMRSMGRSVNEFKAGLNDKPVGLESDEKEEVN